MQGKEPIGARMLRVEIARMTSGEMVELIDLLLTRFLRALNPVASHATGLDEVLWLRAEWLTVEDRIERVIEELTKRSEAAHTEAELEAALRRFGQQHPELAAREETLPW